MEDNRFDSLTRHVGRQTARRTMIKSAVGGTLALLGIGIVDQASEARNRGRNNRGRRTGFENDECATNDDCLEGLRCQGRESRDCPGVPDADRDPGDQRQARALPVQAGLRREAERRLQE